MKIKRVVNGQEVEFELTGIELIQASREQDEYDNRDDLETVLDEDFDGEVELTETEFTEAIRLFRKYRSNSDEWRYDARDAISEILKERRDK